MPKKKDKALTPGDLARAVFGNDVTELFRAICSRGRKAPQNKYKSRTIGRNAKGDPVVKKTVFTKEHLDKEKAKKAAAKKKAAEAKKKEE